MLARLFKQEWGGSLVETVAAVGNLGGVTILFLAALATQSVATRSLDGNDQAINLVQTQLEDVQNAVYNTNNCYPVSVTAPTEYSVSVTVTTPGSGLQLVTVSASRGAATLLSVQMYKANLSGTTVTQAC